MIICFVVAAFFGLTALKVTTISAIGQYESAAWSFVALAFVLLIGYLVTSYSIVEIASPAAEIQFKIPWSKRDEALELVGKLEFAKNERYLKREHIPEMARSETSL
jgi:hypothetical protein